MVLGRPNPVLTFYRLPREEKRKKSHNIIQPNKYKIAEKSMLGGVGGIPNRQVGKPATDNCQTKFFAKEIWLTFLEPVDAVSTCTGFDHVE